MSSHGVARTARSRTQEQRRVDLDKIQKYRSLEDEVRLQITGSQYGQETFQLTSKLLRLNPEYYTIWNARRRCLISGLLSKPSAGSSPSKASPNTAATDIPTSSSADLSPSSSKETPPAPDSPITGKSGTTPEQRSESAALNNSNQERDAQVIRSELGFTIPLLMEFPKCYWIWGYRLWILQQAIHRLPIAMARRIWEEELGLVSKMLTKDRRNFHAWGYRRHVVGELESSALDGRSMVEPEFEYTTKKINEDLSNFSAWHNRSQLIPRLLDERKSDNDSRRTFLDKELELIRGALNVGPEDQSLWFYHQFLVLGLVETSGRTAIAPHLTKEERKTYIDHEIIDIKDLLEDYNDIKWIYEALLEYTIAIVQLNDRELEKEEQRDVRQWLRMLRELDPMRNGRWNDLEKDLGFKPGPEAEDGS
ncbi:Fc.00g029980.m01.CDS01 [Cosmosporella sp. VM-42]